MSKIVIVFLLIGGFFSVSVKEILAAPLIGKTSMYQTRGGEKCNWFNSCIEEGQDISIELNDISYGNGTPIAEGDTIGIWLEAIGTGCISWPKQDAWPIIPWHEVTSNNGSASLTVSGSNIKPGCSYKTHVRIKTNITNIESAENIKVYQASPQVKVECSEDEEQCNTDLSMNSNYELCEQIKPGTSERTSCENCFVGGGIWTAIGCIPTQPESVIKVVITIGLGLGGGIVLVMILAGSFMLSVSQGDPNKTKEAKEIITSAIIGLLFVIFSVTILQFIGVSILQIPGFGE